VRASPTASSRRHGSGATGAALVDEVDIDQLHRLDGDRAQDHGAAAET
jgi:hypothetical protein